MVLPTDVPTLRAATPDTHAAWHNELDGIMPDLGLPTVSGVSVNHLAHHKLLDELVGVEPLEPVTGFRDHIPGAHKTIHEFFALFDNAVQITTASNVQSVLDANADGTLFLFEPGTYRPPSSEGYQPKLNQIIMARTTGTIINGSKLLTGWTVAGATWWASAFLPGAYDGTGSCRADGDNGLCTHRQDVFYDDVLMTRVASQGAVTAGTFFTDYAANRVYVGSDPNGHTVEQAWNNYAVKATANGVQVLNFIIEKTASRAQEAAIANRGNGGRNAFCEVRKNQGGGIELGPTGTSNSGTHVHHCRVHHNGQMGINGSGNSHKVQQCEVDNNNTKLYAHGWEAGGIKTGEPSWYDGIFRKLWVHHNGGPGIWQDVAAGTTLVEDCHVDHNITGIMFEISYGKRPYHIPQIGGTGTTRILNNVTVHNVWDADPGLESSYGIVNMCSPDVEIAFNSTYDERANIGGFQQARLAETPDPRGDKVIKNFNVHDNFMDFGTVDPTWTGKTGIWSDTGDPVAAFLVSAGANNRWQGNDYRYTDDTIPWFDWGGPDFWKTHAQFQALGQDTSGSVFTEGSPLTPPSPPTLVVGPRHFSA